MPARRSSPGKVNQIQKSRTYLSQPQDQSQKKYILKLYISGMTLRSRMAIDNIQGICRNYLQDRCDLEIIDIFKYPSRARTAQVIAVPTLVKESPLPLHRLVGDLSHIDKVLAGLDIVHTG